MFRLFDAWVSGLKVFEIIRAIEFGQWQVIYMKSSKLGKIFGYI